MAESKKELKGERGACKSWLKKLNIQKTKIMSSGPITSWQIDGETMETMTDFIFLGSKIIEDDCSDFMVTATMKLKDSCSLEEKL